MPAVDGACSDGQLRDALVRTVKISPRRMRTKLVDIGLSGAAADSANRQRLLQGSDTEQGEGARTRIRRRARREQSIETRELIGSHRNHSVGRFDPDAADDFGERRFIDARGGRLGPQRRR